MTDRLRSAGRLLLVVALMTIVAACNASHVTKSGAPVKVGPKTLKMFVPAAIRKRPTSRKRSTDFPPDDSMSRSTAVRTTTLIRSERSSSSADYGQARLTLVSSPDVSGRKRGRTASLRYRRRL
jgi:hypothetical protein